MRRHGEDLKPVHRGAVRSRLGKLYYTGRRLALWSSGRYRFAGTREMENLPYLSFQHQTVLLRTLKDVDMVYQHNKIINLKIAVPKLDGILLLPGETFSYWKLIGRITKRKGYVDGMVLHYGSFHYGLGGGLCQLSNLIYWMTLHTPLTVVERYRHSFDVFPDSNRTQPFGSGATCVYPYRDLMIRNDTEQAFQLRVRVGEAFLEGEWRSSLPPRYRYEIVERDHEMKGEYWGGYSRHNVLYRKKYDIEGTLLDEEYVTENHALMMYSPFLEGALKEET